MNANFFQVLCNLTNQLLAQTYLGGLKKCFQFQELT